MAGRSSVLGVSSQALSEAEAQLRRILPPVTALAGLAGTAGAIAQGFANDGLLRPWALVAYLGVMGLGLFWWWRPPRGPHVAAFLVALVLATGIGTIAWQRETSGPLLHLSVLSVACFYFLVDRRVLIPLQLCIVVLGAVVVARTGAGAAIHTQAIFALVTVIGGVALHLGRVRAIEELERTRSALFKEIAERRRAEEEALHARKLESLGVMAGGVAHDFNNLLVGIVGGTDLAFAARGNPEELRAALEIIRDSSVSAQELCRKMLDYAGGGPLERESVDLNAAVRDAVRLVSGRFPRSVWVTSDLSPTTPHALGDRVQLRQAVVNLLSNAAEAMEPEGGTVSVRTSREQRGGAGVAVICVEDEGGGIPGEIRDRIFDPFFSTRFTGRGLGLAQVAGAIRSHEGTIDLASTPAGTRFVVRLPAAEPVSLFWPMPRDRVPPKEVTH
ncbi:MAG: ATP-binding protein [Myxococcota bacterium]